MSDDLLDSSDSTVTDHVEGIQETSRKVSTRTGELSDQVVDRHEVLTQLTDRLNTLEERLDADEHQEVIDQITDLLHEAQNLNEETTDKLSDIASAVEEQTAELSKLTDQLETPSDSSDNS